MESFQTQKIAELAQLINDEYQALCVVSVCQAAKQGAYLSMIDAEDAVSDGALTVLVKLQDGMQIDDVRSFLRGVIRGKTKNLVRKRIRRERITREQMSDEDSL